jgi:biopolymer transport protein ExbB
MKSLPRLFILLAPLLLAVLDLSSAVAGEAAGDWWKPDWSGRTKFTLDPAAEGAEVKGEAGDTVLLVRLHPGNLPFEVVQADGSDLRFVAADGKVLPFHLEKFDPLMAEGFAWVRVPAVGTGATDFFLYYGNPAPEGEGAPDPAKTYPEKAQFVYHLAESGSPPQDVTANASNAETAGSLSQGTIIGDGLRLVGREPVKIPGTPANAWSSGGELTLVFWIKPISTANEAILFSRPGAGDFRLGLAAGGAPFVEVVGQPRSVSGETVSDSVWRQLAVTAAAGKIALYLDGREVASLDAPLPGGDGPMFVGGPDPAVSAEGRFLGEYDEFQAYSAALPAAAMRLMHVNQSGSETATKLLAFAAAEGGGAAAGGHGGMLEHVMLFGDIGKNMMFDGWIAVGVCVIMMILGWSVAVAKFVRLRALMKGDAEFLRQWGEVSGDLTVLDADDPDSLTSLRMEAMEAKGAGKQQAGIRAMLDSPCYHLYHLGIKEIRHRIAGPDRHRGLSVRSIQAIRASLDAGMVRERQRLNKGLVVLTTSIAGGPYVGLLGTVVGVMITFAIIAKSGEVDVNSIAPGIASALLATTVGLFVAIPALFMYSVLSSRIKDVIASMQVFIDEFVTKIAEAYPPPGEGLPPRFMPPEEAARFEETGGREDAGIMAGINSPVGAAASPSRPAATMPPPPRRAPMPPLPPAGPQSAGITPGEPAYAAD